MNEVTVKINCCDSCPNERGTYSLNAMAARFYCGLNKIDEWEFTYREIPDHCPLLRKENESR